MKVAEIILEQLGGNKFLAMTGAHHLVSDKNTLQMQLPKNASKANRLHITLDAMDTCTMHFFYYYPGKFNKFYEWVGEKIQDVEIFEGVYCDMLQDIFTSVTGMYTHL